MTNNIRVIEKKNIRIALPNSPALKSIVPGFTWSQRPFDFRPKTFYLDHPSLDTSKFFEKDLQINSLENWNKDCGVPRIYVCTSSPEDLPARYFAAYLVNIFINKYRGSSVVWKESSNLENIYSPSLLVLSGLCIETSKYRLEKVRDLVVKYYNIPRIIVGAGTDPITFAKAYLRIPVNGIFYKTENICSISNEVI